MAVNEERYGGNGDVWVSDGYGKFHVHRYDKSGNYLGSINGGEGAGAFSIPHGIYIDRRKDEPELYVGDERNKRIQVYDLDGGYKRTFGADFFSQPYAMTASGDHLFVLELQGRLTAVDLQDRFVAYLGENEAVRDMAGWPNNEDEHGHLIPNARLAPGKFNSPHAITADDDGNLYVAEWLIGGRITKLVRV